MWMNALAATFAQDPMTSAGISEAPIDATQSNVQATTSATRCKKSTRPIHAQIISNQVFFFY